MSARNPKGVEIEVINPTRGLVTRIPSDQPADRKMTNAWTDAQNVRFEDGVVKNAPGYTDIESACPIEGTILGIFQQQLLQNDRPAFKNPIIITNDKIFWVQRSTYTSPNILPCGIDSQEAFGTPTIVTTSNGIIAPSSVTSAESVSSVTIS